MKEIAMRCDWSGARGTFRWSLERIPPILRSKVQSTDLIAEKAGNGFTRRISGSRPTHPVVLMGSKNINANSSDQARAYFPVRRLIQLR